MQMNDDAEITNYLRRVRSGDAGAEDDLAEAVYAKLLVMGRAILRGDGARASLQPTALVNEVLLELIRIRSVEWSDRAHFYRVASRTLRRRIVDHVRRKRRGKRPPDHLRVELDEMLAPPETKFEEILAVHQALDDLTKLDAPLAELVEMTYFGGVTIPAIAEIRQVSERTIIRQLKLAKGALKKILSLRCPDETFFRANTFD